MAAFGAGAFSTATVQYILNGPDLNQLTKYSDQIIAKLKAIPGAVDVDTTLVTGNPELVATVNRPQGGGSRRVSVMDVAMASRLLIGGVKVSRYEEAGREYDILVRAEEAYRTSPEALSQLTVASTKLGTVPLLDVVDLKRAEGPSKIDRYARQRQVMFLANTAPGVGSGEVGAALEKIVKEHEAAVAVPLRRLRTVEGDRADRDGVLDRVRVVVHLHVPDPGGPVRVMAAPDHDPAGAAADGAVRAGVADHARSRRSTSSRCSASWCCSASSRRTRSCRSTTSTSCGRKGTRGCDAILHGNRDRLRPILMTTFAFVAGMLPLLTSHGIGAEFNRATAGPVVGGQLLSLLLTLLATPVAYSLFDDAAIKMRRAVPAADAAGVGDRGRRDHAACAAGPRRGAPRGAAYRSRFVIRAGIAVVIAGLVLADARGAAAQAPDLPAVRDTAAREITLEDALALRQETQPSLVAERARLAQAQTNIEAAWAALLPTIARRGGTRATTPSSASPADPGGDRCSSSRSISWTASINFTAPLIVPAAYAGLKSVKDGVRSAEANFEVSEETVLFAVAQAFYAAQISDEVVNTAAREHRGDARDAGQRQDPHFRPAP